MISWPTAIHWSFSRSARSRSRRMLSSTRCISSARLLASTPSSSEPRRSATSSVDQRPAGVASSTTAAVAARERLVSIVMRRMIVHSMAPQASASASSIATTNHDTRVATSARARLALRSSP